ncbi:GNAT family N-acetyltransferase [Shinella pollutisoli]|uniref:GNAT family N-acetyltransferase n=1 Tax=Shinella pollutisoli TaxID=2250594 RepID=A0ABV7DAQ5_9HYPH|nr:GNAT family N-acetyltransferase [Shinella pollutisoli]
MEPLFRSGFLPDRAARLALADLLHETFGIDIRLLDRLGGPDPTAVPLAYFDAAGRCIANLTAFSLPLVVNGASLHAAGLQSGTVHPAWRGRGLYRALMTAALDHCARQGFEAVALLTDTPALYERHGFRTVPQNRFVGPAPPGASGTGKARRLDLDDTSDVGLLRALLEARQPVSRRFAPVRQTEMFLLNAIWEDGVRLGLMERENAAVAWREGPDGAFELLDVAGPAIPPLAAVLAALGLAPERVAVRFPPDRLGWEGEAVAEAGEVVLMLRGADGLPDGPFALSPMAVF